MAMPRSITVVRAGLSGAFNKIVPWIPSSGPSGYALSATRPKETLWAEFALGPAKREPFVNSFILCMLFLTHPHVTTFVNPHFIPLYDLIYLVHLPYAICSRNPLSPGPEARDISLRRCPVPARSSVAVLFLLGLEAQDSSLRR